MVLTNKQSKNNFDFKGRTLHGGFMPAKDRLFEVKKKAVGKT